MNNLEIFYSDSKDQEPDTAFWSEEDNTPLGSGYYYWFCFPGCLPDSDPFGPFLTYLEAELDSIEIFELRENEVELEEEDI